MKKFLVRLLITVMVLGVFQTGNSAYEVKAEEPQADIYYATHCQTYGWSLGVSKNGELSGTEGQSKRLESIKIWVESNLSGSVEYETHCQTYGWLNSSKDGEENGTTGQGKRLEAIKIWLTGELGEYYDVIYRVHRQTYGWSDWVKNGETSGTTGQGKRLEAIQIKLVKKGTSQEATVRYRTHCQTYGWLPYVNNGEMSGTSGEAKRLEAILVDIPDTTCTGGITYQVHCQTYGWMDWTTNNMSAGTSGQAKRLEAIRIKLTGEMADRFDVYYRVHSQTFGWLDWACNGETSGTAGLSKRLEAIEIVLVEKGETAPGQTARPYIDKSVLDQMAAEAEEEKRQQEEAEKDANDKATSENLRQTLNNVVLNPMKTNDPRMDNQVQSILASIITPDMDNYEKVYACYNWIIKNASYKYESGYTNVWNLPGVSYANQRDQQVVSFAYPILIGKEDGSKYGTCINYASALVLMTRALGFDSYRVGGETIRADNSYGEHYWTVIKIDGIWYNFDPQNADNSWADPLKYFGKTNSEWLANGYKFTHGSEKAQDYISTGEFKTR